MRDYLFGFTTVRNPAAITSLERTRFHILMIESDRQKTHYWSGLNRDTFDGLRQEVRRRSRNFTGVPSFQTLESTFSNLLSFYRGAKSERRRVNLSDLHEFAASLDVTPLTSSQRVLLWDSFAHYLWVESKKPAVDTIRAIMVADKLLNALEDVTPEELRTSETQATMRRLLDAQVVLPLPLDRRGRQSPREVMSARQREMLERAHDRLVGAVDVRDLIRAREDLSLAVARHRITQSERERNARTHSANVIRSEGGATLSTHEVERVASALASRLSASSRPPEDEVSTVIGTITSPLSLAVLHPLRAQSVTITALLDTLNDKIEETEAKTEGAIEVVHLASFLAFGTDLTIEERIPPGSVVVKAKRSSNSRFALYLSYFHDRKRPQIIELSGRIHSSSAVVGIEAEVLDIEDDRFQTFRLSADSLQGVVRVSLSLRTVSPNAPLVNLDLFSISLQIPHFDVPDLTEDPVIGIQPPPLFGINRLGVIDYRRVEQELACYVTGAVSRIENIPARAFKERNSRTLSVTEVEQEVTQELASERQSDTETAQKLEMQSEVAKVLREESGKTFDFGAGVSVELPGVGSLTTNTALNFNSQSSREDSTTQAITAAKSVTQKVQEKLVQKATSRRKSLSRTEFEDIIKHGFDNRLGEEHVVCVFRWLDQIMNNFLVNYGRMSVIEFEIPEPAKNFIRAQETTHEEEDFKGHRPKLPKHIGLHGPNSVRRSNYRNFAAVYGIELDPPPRATIVLSRAFADSPPLEGTGEDTGLSTRAVAYNEIGIPDGYVAVSASVLSHTVLSRAWYEDETNPTHPGVLPFHCSIGNSSFDLVADGESRDLNKIEGSLGVSVTTKMIDAFAFSVTVQCRLKGEVFADWQHRAYSKLIAAYQKLKDEYEEQRAAHEEQQNKAVGLNPRFMKQVMERELKRVCIQIMAQQHGIDITGDHYGPAPEGKLHPLILSQQLDRHSELVRFLEQAINWPLMSYIFYPYFYSKEDTWVVKISHEATKDQLFGAFLSSGMGRIAVPITLGFESAFNYFLETGHVWFGGGFVLDSEDDLYLSIADEMLRGTEEQVIEERWQTKLPTNHTILQSAAAAMIGEGLPCEIADNRIGVGTSRLRPVLPSETSGTPT